MQEYLNALEELVQKIHDINTRLDSVTASVQTAIDSVKGMIEKDQELINESKRLTEHND